MCGDWLLGAGAESAVRSAEALSAQIVAAAHAGEEGAVADFSVGLQDRLVPLKGMEDIGEFPQ